MGRKDSDLPTGLSGAWNALSYGEREDIAHDRLTSLIFTRQLLDPAMPSIGGIEPGTVLGGIKNRWVPQEPEQPRLIDPEEDVAWWDAETLDKFAWAINRLSGFELLREDWHTVKPAVVDKAVHEFGRFNPSTLEHMAGGDIIGEVSQRVKRGGSANLGQFFTPWPICLFMAQMTYGDGDLPVGATVLDPACGSGRFLLAALEVWREKNGRFGTPEVFGIDIDPRMVRLTRMNLILADVHPAGRVECEDFLRMTPAAELTPTQQAMQQQLFELTSAGEQQSWRERFSAEDSEEEVA